LSCGVAAHFISMNSRDHRNPFLRINRPLGTPRPGGSSCGQGLSRQRRLRSAASPSLDRFQPWELRRHDEMYGSSVVRRQRYPDHSDPIGLGLDNPTQFPSLIICSLPRSREGFGIYCLCSTLEDEVLLGARLDVDRAEVRQSDDDFSTLRTHVKPHGCSSHAGAATAPTAPGKASLILTLTPGLRRS